MLRAAALTVAVETAFFLIIGYRDRLLLLYWAIVNLFTNLLLNLSLRLLTMYGVRPDAVRLLVYPAEIAVVLIEWALLAMFLGRSKRLPALVFISNLLSYLTGLLLHR